MLIPRHTRDHQEMLERNTCLQGVRSYVGTRTCLKLHGFSSLLFKIILPVGFCWMEEREQLTLFVRHEKRLKLWGDVI